MAVALLPILLAGCVWGSIPTGERIGPGACRDTRIEVALVTVDLDTGNLTFNVRSLGSAYDSDGRFVDNWNKVESAKGETYLHGTWNLSAESTAMVRVTATSPLPTDPWLAYVFSYHDAGGSQVHRIRCSLEGDGAPESFL